MLNPFPFLLDFSLLAPLILRLAVGLIIIGFGKEHIKHGATWKPFFEMIGFKSAGMFVAIVGYLEVLAGVMLIAGLGVQWAAMFGALVSAVAVTIEYKNESLIKRDLVFHILLLCVFLSLILSGAGIPALDLPL